MTLIERDDLMRKMREAGLSDAAIAKVVGLKYAAYVANRIGLRRDAALEPNAERNAMMRKMREYGLPDRAIADLVNLKGGPSSVHYILGPRPPSSSPTLVKPPFIPRDAPAIIGAWLRDYRIRNNLTQADLAEILGVSLTEKGLSSTISSWETERTGCALPVPVIGYLTFLEDYDLIHKP